jgi:hypothetical protein
MAFSQQVTYTDQAATACRQSYCRLLRADECRVVTELGTHGR